MTQPEPQTAKRGDLLAGCAAGLFVLFLVEMLVGSLLEFSYRGTASGAFPSVSSMQLGGLSLFRSFHYWSSALLIAGSLATLIWMLFAKWFNGGHNRMWLAVGLLYISSLLSQITGNLLPFDRHGVETAVIESGVAGRTPFVGSTLQSTMLHGAKFNESTIGVWHAAHIGLWILGAAAAWLFWVGCKDQPRSRALMWLPPVLAAAFALMAKAPLGNQASAADFGSYDAQVSWYTWPLHGSLNLFSRISSQLGWIGSVVIPSLFALFIISAPYISRRFSAKAIQTTFLCFGAYFLIAALFFGGRFAPLVGNRDPVALDPIVRPVAVKVDPVLYARGRTLFNTNACAGCHGVDGRSGAEGPSLIGVAQRRGSDPNWYMQFIKNPANVKPNTMMPSFPEIPAVDTRAIAEFLIHQKP